MLTMDVELIHDLRMPLQLICAGAQLLRLSLDDDTVDARACVDMLVESAEHMCRMLERALEDCGRAPRGAPRLVNRDIAACVRELMAGETPAACCYAMCAFLLREAGGKELVAVLPDETLPETLKAVLAKWSPELSVLVKSPARAEKLREAAPFTGAMSPKDGKAVCYVCENGACGLPMEL